MRVVHANWTGGALHLWVESAAQGEARESGRHPGSEDSEIIARVLSGIPGVERGVPGTIALRLPTLSGAPARSERLVHAVGVADADPATESLEAWNVTTLALDAGAALDALDALEDRAAQQRERLGQERDDDADPGSLEIEAGDGPRRREPVGGRVFGHDTNFDGMPIDANHPFYAGSD